jgi:hypothetical protein
MSHTLRWNTRILVSVAAVLAVAAYTAAQSPRWTIHTRKETWTGLDGKVLEDGLPVELPNLLWRIASADVVEETDIIPAPIVLVGRKLQQQKLNEEKNSSGNVYLRVRGKRVERNPGNGQFTTIPSDFDGSYLGFDPTGASNQLVLTNKLGKDCEWRAVDLEERISKGKGDFQFDVKQKTEFRLKAVGRDGWYLGADTDGRLCLTKERIEKRLITVEVEKLYGDLTDGP